MKNKIALALTAYDAENHIEKSLLNIKNGIELFPEDIFTLFIIDDGSNDKTYQAILDWGTRYRLNLKASRNQRNLGVVLTLKKVYNEVFKSDNDFVIKTDLDLDFNQKTVIERFVPYTKSDKELVAGVRWREFTYEENPTEFLRRKEELKILKEEFGIKGLDPPSTGSQFYRSELLRELFSWPVVQMYDRRWSLDMLLDLLAIKLGKKVEIINLEDGNYDVTRRPKDKVDEQYNSDIDIISLLTGKHPKELSKFYNR